ncbi:MAG: EamA family transporter [Anaerolineae bacterium]|nr:EamA family transporter [Anaerolineae bacterium]
MTATPSLLVNLATLIWASNITLGRALRADIGPVLLTFFRVLIASLVFAFVLRRGPRPQALSGWPIPGGDGGDGHRGFPSHPLLVGAVHHGRQRPVSSPPSPPC